MKVWGSIVFCVVCGVGAVTEQTTTPSLAEVALSLAFVNSNADYGRLWIRLKGDALTAVAVSTRRSDKMQAAILLAGTIMASGETLPVETNGLSTLCGVMLSNPVRDRLFSEEVFKATRDSMLARKRLPIFSVDRRKQKIEEFFPLINFPHVCGNDLPLKVKLNILKIRALYRTVTTFVGFDQYAILFSTLSVDPPSLEKSFAEWLEVDDNSDDMGFVFAGGRVNNDDFDLIPKQPAVSAWLHGVIGEMFTSRELFTKNTNGELDLAVQKDNPLLKSYTRIGQLLGLAVMNNVPIGVSLDMELLHALVSKNEQLPEEYLRVRFGFNGVLSAFSLWGSYYSPRRLLNEKELHDVLRGVY